ncbi:Nup93/Nic96 [Musa troglodytarum]|uniref:Nuclear pore protein n=1 Tax=Musa troglodytarum TaxID=320322 RepID=A0A9E7F8W4_9LILI|nr:Nup93/Nic96 [Musa troglodytarum]
MANDQEMSGWTDLLHSSTKLLEHAGPSAHFPSLQRNLDQLESLSKKLKSKTIRAEAPSQSISATRLLAREGINAERLARDLKSFELKTTFEDVFPSEATTVEDYLQQIHEMTMVSSIQEAQKDNLRSFNDHMMQVLESVEIHKRVGAFSVALETVNKCLSDVICAMSRGSLQEKEPVSEQQTVLRQLEAILHINKLARAGQHVDALREIIKIPFLPLNPRVPDVHYDVFQKLSPHVQACVPDLLKIALNCLDNVKDTDGTLRALKSKIANLVANNMNRNWPQDLIEKVAQSI